MSDERLIFEGNRIKSAILLLVCALFLCVGIFFAMDGDRWAIVVIMISAFAFLFILPTLIPGNLRLTIDSAGLELKSPLRSMKLAWSDVEKFYVGYVHTGPATSKLIAIKYSQTCDKKRVTNTERGIPNHFNKSPEELCELLNSYKQLYGPSKQ
ncbi:MAG: hypothetical protein V7638_1846 [Acidobacteriota bacterium]|jgi:hypothetical protein